MTNPSEALQLILQKAQLLSIETIDINNAFDRYLAQPVISKYDHPFFNQSAMDGYAFNWNDLAQSSTLYVSDEIAAGRKDLPQLKKGEAFRIYTGAAVPDSCDTVVIQEHVERLDNTIKITKAPHQFANIRKQGEQILKGSVALNAGHVLNSSAIGFLASIGIKEVTVFKKPRAFIITTGNEFLLPNEAQKPGKIFESNGLMLQSALKKLEINADKTTCEDELQSLVSLIEKGALNNDILLITGGVSVGDFDYTPEALRQAGFNIHFHKLNQKPGKPLLFASNKNGTLAFGLPGNPQSVLSCFYHYVIPSIRLIQGANQTSLTKCYLPVLEDINNNSGKTLFIFAKLTSNGVMPLKSKGSHTLSGPAQANASIEIAPDITFVKTGQKVLTHILPNE